jgi:hypothetical protein
VIRRQEPILTRNLFLQLFNLRMNKFNNTSTAFTDNVVVVVFFINVLKARLSVGKVLFRREPAFDKQLHRAVHRGVSNARVHLPHFAVQLFNTDMPIRGEEDLGNILTLRGCFESLFFNPLPKNF